MSTTKYLDPETMMVRITQFVKANEPNFQLKSTPGYFQMIVRNIDAAVHAHERGKFYVVHSTQFPNELFIAMDIEPLFNELYSTIVGIFSDDNQAFLGVSDELGFPCYNCSYYRTFYGMIEKGAWPKPDFVCYSSSPCDNTPKGQEMAAKAMGVPSFGMDRPYKLFTAQSQAYWRKEHESLIRFLEEQTGRKMDYDRLKEVVRLSYRSTEIYQEINELRKAIPSPVPAEAAFAPMAVYRSLIGTQECVDFLEQLRDELEERIAKGIGAVKQERFRYVCATSLPFFDYGLMSMMEQKYGAVNVMDLLQLWREKAEWLIDPEDPVGSLAYKVSLGPANSIHGPKADQAEEVKQMALQYKADGVLYFNNLGCRHAAGAFRIVKDKIERELGIPWATIDCDMLDKSFTTNAKVSEQLDAFFERVEDSKHYKERRKTI